MKKSFGLDMEELHLKIFLQNGGNNICYLCLGIWSLLSKPSTNYGTKYFINHRIRALNILRDKRRTFSFSGDQVQVEGKLFVCYGVFGKAILASSWSLSPKHWKAISRLFYLDVK